MRNRHATAAIEPPPANEQPDPQKLDHSHGLLVVTLVEAPHLNEQHSVRKPASKEPILVPEPPLEDSKRLGYSFAMATALFSNQGQS